jgi:hypothetical protein
MDFFADLGFRQNFQISLLKTAFGGIPSLETNFGGIAQDFGGIARTQLWLQISTTHEHPISAELEIVEMEFRQKFTKRIPQIYNIHYILIFFGCFHGEPLRAGRSERPDMEAAPAFGGGRLETKGFHAVRI